MRVQLWKTAIGVAAFLSVAAILLGFRVPLPVRASGNGPKTLPPESVPAEVSNGTAQRIGPHPIDDSLQLLFMLPLRDAAGLAQFNAELGQRGSANYQHPLTLDQANARFNPDPLHEKAVVDWLQANGVSAGAIRTVPNHLFVEAHVPVKLINSLLNVTIGDYKDPADGNRNFFAPDRSPVLPAAISADVTWITGLDNAHLYHTFNDGIRAGGGQGNSPSDFAYCPAGWLYAYDAMNMIQAGTDGTGVTIAITLWSQAPSDATLTTWSGSAATQTGCSGSPVATRANGRLSVIFTDGSQSADTNDVEASMDIETAGGTAIGAHVSYYEALQPTDADLAIALNQAGTNANVQLISNSWGRFEDQTGINALDSVFQSNSATGHVYVFSSGDNGSFSNGQDPFPNYPASSQYVLSVGGTRFNGPITTAGWPGEQTWLYQAASGGNPPVGSGGGFSNLINRPAYQVAPGFNSTKRGYPDVAAVGDPATGAFVCSNSQGCGGVGGTSLAAPLWAALLGIINEDLHNHSKPYFSNPGATLYGLYATAQGRNAFHDITVGTNGAYNATANWDAITGLGSPDTALLSAALQTGAATPTRTATRTVTRTATRSATRTITRTATRTGTRTATRTVTRTATGSATRTSTRTATRTPTRTATPVLSCPAMTWTHLVGVTASADQITKTNTVSNWNSGAVSGKSLASGNGYVQITVDSVTNYVMFGLGKGDANASYTDIDYGLLQSVTGAQLQVWENGVQRTLATNQTYKVGDVLKVAVEGSAVKYYKNSTLIYTSSVALSYPLLLDSSIYAPNATIKQAKICGVSLGAVTGALPDEATSGE